MKTTIDDNKERRKERREKRKKKRKTTTMITTMTTTMKNDDYNDIVKATTMQQKMKKMRNKRKEILWIRSNKTKKMKKSLGKLLRHWKKKAKRGRRIWKLQRSNVSFFVGFE